jgi:hypothetical protein
MPLTEPQRSFGTFMSLFGMDGISPDSPIRIDTLPPGLLIAGKRNSAYDTDKLLDQLCLLDDQGRYLAELDAWSQRNNSRLVMDPDGQLYQLNSELGLICPATGEALVSSAAYDVAEDPRFGLPAVVYLGVQGHRSGRPMLDAAFDTEGHLYVTPVVVQAADHDPYLAAARLDRQDDGAYELGPVYARVLQINDNFQDYPNQIDWVEGRLYMVNSNTHNESDLLTVYDTDSGDLLAQVPLTGPDAPVQIPTPSALYVSPQDRLIYLASGRQSADAQSDTLYGLSSETYALQRELVVHNLGHITDVTSNPVNGDLWIIGFVMTDIPDDLDIDAEPFYHPGVATIPAGWSDPVFAQPPSGEHHLALPLSVIWTGSAGGAGRE